MQPVRVIRDSFGCRGMNLLWRVSLDYHLGQRELEMWVFIIMVLCRLIQMLRGNRQRGRGCHISKRLIFSPLLFFRFLHTMFSFAFVVIAVVASAGAVLQFFFYFFLNALLMFILNIPYKSLFLLLAVLKMEQRHVLVRRRKFIPFSFHKTGTFYVQYYTPMFIFNMLQRQFCLTWLQYSHIRVEDGHVKSIWPRRLDSTNSEHSWCSSPCF